MKKRQQGIGAIQILAALGSMVVVASVAAPKYQDYVIKTKVSEAFNLTTDSKTKLTEFFIMKNRFPRSDKEIESMQTETFSPPEFVSEIKMNFENDDHEILVEVYFKEGVLSEAIFADNHIYIAGNTSTGTGSLVEWSCGANGIDQTYLPPQCQ